MAELYCLTFPSGKQYIGITSRTAAERFKDHCNNANRDGKFAIHKALLKYGAASVSVKTLVVGSWKYLCEMEKKAIAAFKTKSPFGYNLTDGGEGVVGNVMSEESKQLLSALNTGKVMLESSKQLISIAVTERMANPEVREQISKKLKGKVVSEATRDKLSVAKLGIKTGPLTDSTKERMAVSQKARRAREKQERENA